VGEESREGVSGEVVGLPLDSAEMYIGDLRSASLRPVSERRHDAESQWKRESRRR